jgi:hypothetical protein
MSKCRQYVLKKKFRYLAVLTGFSHSGLQNDLSALIRITLFAYISLHHIRRVDNVSYRANVHNSKQPKSISTL